MFITSKNKYLSNDMKIFETCSIPLILCVVDDIFADAVSKPKSKKTSKKKMAEGSRVAASIFDDNSPNIFDDPLTATNKWYTFVLYLGNYKILYIDLHYQRKCSHCDQMFIFLMNIDFITLNLVWKMCHICKTCICLVWKMCFICKTCICLVVRKLMLHESFITDVWLTGVS